MSLTPTAFSLEKPADPLVREPVLIHPRPGCVCYVADLRGKKLVTGTFASLGTWEQRKEMSKGKEPKIPFGGKFWFVFMKSCWVFF